MRRRKRGWSAAPHPPKLQRSRLQQSRPRAAFKAHPPPLGEWEEFTGILTGVKVRPDCLVLTARPNVCEIEIVLKPRPPGSQPARDLAVGAEVDVLHTNLGPIVRLRRRTRGTRLSGRPPQE